MLVLATSGAVAMAHLFLGSEAWPSSPYGTSYDLLVPSVMLATGRGFVVPADSDLPALNEFLVQERWRLSAGALPRDLTVEKPGPFLQSRRYLIYTVAYMWRLCGVSWTGMCVLLTVFFSTTVVLAYALFRLAMGRALSALCALLFMLGPAPLAVLANLRDFSKAPFVLSIMLILGHLAKGPFKLKAILGLSILLGAIHGVGIGFRRDVFVCIVPSVLVLALCARWTDRLAISRRLGLVALFLLSFLVTGWPILATYSPGGSQSYQNVLGGLATVDDDALGLRRASYERSYIFNDVFLLTIADSFARRVSPDVDLATSRPGAYPPAEKQFLIEVAKTFPADLITRGYAAVLRVLGGVNADGLAAPWWDVHPGSQIVSLVAAVERAVARHLSRFGVCYAVAALLGLSWHSSRLAWFTLLLTLYFGAYPCLQFQFRHYFHLSFVELWFPGAIVSAVVCGLTRAIDPAVRERARKAILLPRQWWSPGFRRMAVFSLGAVALVLVPLHAARAYQCHKMQEVMQQHAAAALEPLEVEERRFGDLVLFAPGSPVTTRSCLMSDWRVTHRTAYLMAVFSPGSEKLPFWIRYECAWDFALDFSQIVIMNEQRGPAPDAGEVRYFFPVYEFAGPATEGWSRFAGVALREDQASRFKGLYRVRDPEQFRLLLNLTAPSDDASFRAYQRLQFHVEELEPYYYALRLDPCPSIEAMTARNLASQGELEAAIRVYRNALEFDPKNVGLRTGLGTALEANGDRVGALAAYREAIASAPNFIPVDLELDAMLEKCNDPDCRVAAWRGLVRDYPGIACAHFCLGMALEAAHDINGAIEAYRAAKARAPSDEGIESVLNELVARNLEDPSRSGP